MRTLQTNAGAVAAIEAALIVLVRRATLPRLQDALAAQAGVSLDRALYVALGRIADRGEMRLSELAADLSVDVSTVSRQVKRLEAAGLVTRRADDADARASVLAPTPEGRLAIDKLRAARRDAVGRLLDGLPEQDLDDLARLLTELADRMVAYTEAL